MTNGRSPEARRRQFAMIEVVNGKWLGSLLCQCFVGLIKVGTSVWNSDDFGVPLHLKTKDIAMALSNVCGSSPAELDETSLNCYSKKILVKSMQREKEDVIPSWPKMVSGESVVVENEVRQGAVDHGQGDIQNSNFEIEVQSGELPFVIQSGVDGVEEPNVAGKLNMRNNRIFRNKVFNMERVCVEVKTLLELVFDRKGIPTGSKT
ncbi:hypothetical protein IFM89_010954 [Coptis chinensis]|uniref:Uncharacterized protein n=1 Tax=Coptis chinensis TaxID=261450 RepID=A0A835IN21_9MAGN|nr:hypothetical protein IFM89_010954 [Coptis chinensis]